MISSFFSDLREVASTVDGVEARLRDREALDVDGPQHHILQRAALEKFRKDVSDTKASMKSFQPTVVSLQNFGRLNEISSQLLSLHQRRVDSLKSHLSQYGYEGPPAKQLKPNQVVDDDARVNVENAAVAPPAKGKENCQNVVGDAATARTVVCGVSSCTASVDPRDFVDDEDMDVSEDPNSGHPPNVPVAAAALTANGTTSSTEPSYIQHHRQREQGVDFPKSPKLPVLHSSTSTTLSAISDDVQRSSVATSSFSEEAVGGDDDDSVLAMELPPTPVYPDMTWQPQAPVMAGLPSVACSSSAISSAPMTPVSALAMTHTPTPPSLLSTAKKTLDVTKIDFSGLEDGEVFHTGLTPKTPELHSMLTSMPCLPSTLSTRGGFLDTPFDGRATPSSPESQQSFESLKRALRFNAEAPPQRSVNLMKPISFVEFEQKQQKLEGISRDLLNNAIKMLNAVFREKDEAKESMDLPQSQVVAIFNQDNDHRLGTKIILMLLKFRRIDCRSVNGLSYVSPSSDADDSILDMTNNDD